MGSGINSNSTQGNNKASLSHIEQARANSVEHILSASKITDEHMLSSARNTLTRAFANENTLAGINYVKNDLIERMVRSQDMSVFLVLVLPKAISPSTPDGVERYKSQEWLSPPNLVEAANIVKNGGNAWIDKLAYHLATGSYSWGEFKLDGFTVPAGFDDAKKTILARPYDVPSYEDWAGTDSVVGLQKKNSNIYHFIEYIMAAKESANIDFHGELFEAYADEVKTKLDSCYSTYKRILSDYKKSNLIFSSEEQRMILFATATLGNGNGANLAGEIAAKAHLAPEIANSVTKSIFSKFLTTGTPQNHEIYAASPVSLDAAETAKGVSIPIGKKSYTIMLDGACLSDLRLGKTVQKALALGGNGEEAWKKIDLVFTLGADGKIYAFVDTRNPANLLCHYESSHNYHTKTSVQAFEGLLNGVKPAAGTWDMTLPLKCKYSSEFKNAEKILEAEKVYWLANKMLKSVEESRSYYQRAISAEIYDAGLISAFNEIVAEISGSGGMDKVNGLYRISESEYMDVKFWFNKIKSEIYGNVDDVVTEGIIENITKVRNDVNIAKAKESFEKCKESINDYIDSINKFSNLLDEHAKSGDALKRAAYQIKTNLQMSANFFKEKLEEITLSKDFDFSPSNHPFLNMTKSMSLITGFNNPAAQVQLLIQQISMGDSLVKIGKAAGDGASEAYAAMANDPNFSALLRDDPEKLADIFRTLNSEFGIKFFSRYSAKTLINAYETATNPSFSQGTRNGYPIKTAIMVLNKNDWNNAFKYDQKLYDTLIDHGYNLIICEADNQDEVVKRILFNGKLELFYEQKKYDLLVLGGHGTREGINYGPIKSQESEIDMDEVYTLGRLEDLFNENACVVLNSCSTGAYKKPKDAKAPEKLADQFWEHNQNIMETIAYATRQKTFAPDRPTAITMFKFDSDGRIYDVIYAPERIVNFAPKTNSANFIDTY